MRGIEQANDLLGYFWKLFIAIFHVLVLQMLLVSLPFSDLGSPCHFSHSFSKEQSEQYWYEHAGVVSQADWSPSEKPTLLRAFSTQNKKNTYWRSPGKSNTENNKQKAYD